MVVVMRLPLTTAKASTTEEPREGKRHAGICIGGGAGSTGLPIVTVSKGESVKLIRVFAISLFFVLLFGCASMNPPSSSLIETKPVVTIGEASNTLEDHIVFIPANKEFPIVFSVKGSVFNETVSSNAIVSFKQDMYLYKYWASLDGEKWVNSHKLMNVELSGGFDVSGGKVGVEINLAK
jgi:hypothetical protein